MNRWLLICALMLSVCAAWAGEDVKAKVVGVKDGDTLSVLCDGSAKTVRLAGIDCPEKGQPYCTKAKQFTSG